MDWVSGAVLLVYRADAEAAGLLDERYFLYTEDVDFCAAIRARGRRVLFTPEATVTHLRGRSRATVPGAMNAAYRRSHLAFYEKHHPYWAPLLRIYLRLKGQLPPAQSDQRRPGGVGGPGSQNGATEKTEVPEKNKHVFSVFFVDFVAPFLRSGTCVESSSRLERLQGTIRCLPSAHSHRCPEAS